MKRKTAERILLFWMLMIVGVVVNTMYLYGEYGLFPPILSFDFIKEVLVTIPDPYLGILLFTFTVLFYGIGLMLFFAHIIMPHIHIDDGC